MYMYVHTYILCQHQSHTLYYVYFLRADEIDLHFKRSLAKAKNQQPFSQHVQGTSLPTKKQVVLAT